MEKKRNTIECVFIDICDDGMRGECENCDHFFSGSDCINDFCDACEYEIDLLDRKEEYLEYVKEQDS